MLAAHNLVGNLLLPAAVYVPVNLVTAVALVGMARASGVSWSALGLSGSNLGRGAAVGAGAFFLVAVAIIAAALVPATRPLFDDERAARIAGAAVAYHALVRIPLGTVVLEEVAFRGVLLGLLMRSSSTAAAVAFSSALFGLWHIVPAIEALRANDLTPSAPVVAASVVATAAAGVVLCLLRLHSGSIVAPAFAHLATNSVSLLVAVAVRHTG